MAAVVGTPPTLQRQESQQPQQAVAERQDIHKSCLALETVVNLLNDYCEAARAVVSLQKKLTKALRDAAGIKTTGEIAGKPRLCYASLYLLYMLF
jgi:hypothetical protein